MIKLNVENNSYVPIQCQLDQPGTDDTYAEVFPAGQLPPQDQELELNGALLNALGRGTLVITAASEGLEVNWLGLQHSAQSSSFSDVPLVTVSFDEEDNATISIPGGSPDLINLKNPGDTIVVANGTTANWIHYSVFLDGSGVASGYLGNTTSGLTEVAVAGAEGASYQVQYSPFGFDQGTIHAPSGVQVGQQVALATSIEISEES